MATQLMKQLKILANWQFGCMKIRVSNVSAQTTGYL